MNSTPSPRLGNSCTALAIALLFAVGTVLRSADIVNIQNASGVAQTNYPIQIGHAFLPGEVAHGPVLLAGGSAIPTQATVTHFWADGSARFAKIHAIVPSIPATGSVQLSFGSAPPSVGAIAPGVIVGNLLAAFSDFDCTMTFTQSGTTRIASARAMMAAGAYEFLSHGSVCTELRLADHTGRSYDFGFDTHKTIRPAFYVTFWPTLNKVRVRCVVESPNLDALKETTYDIVVTLGLAAPVGVYSKTGVTHHFGTRWTKVFWQGGTPEPKINLQTDLAHLAQTGFVPNYDPANIPSANELAYQWSSWQSKARDIFEFGSWTPYMPSTGGRGDIGPIPAWHELWLHTGDWRAREIALGNADLAASWPLHFREHDNTKFWDRSATVTAAAGRSPSTSIPLFGFPTTTASTKA